MVRDVTDSHRAHELNRKLAGRLIATQEEERHRIARELHDDLGQKVALLNIEVSEISRKMEGRGQQAALERLTEQAADIARDLRALSHELHPSHLDIVGLVASIRSLCAEVAQKCECQVTFSAGDVTNPIDPNVALCLYRVTQEALHNVAKHSRATRACVRLTQGPADLHLQIDDNGIGFDAAAVHAGLGLASMRERVAIFDGSFVIQRGPEGGTRVDVLVPTTAPN
jgi:signal transduction histidine kinase